MITGSPLAMLAPIDPQAAPDANKPMANTHPRAVVIAPLAFPFLFRRLLAAG
jgi:hypothetical protein